MIYDMSRFYIVSVCKMFPETGPGIYLQHRHIPALSTYSQKGCLAKTLKIGDCHSWVNAGDYYYVRINSPKNQKQIKSRNVHGTFVKPPFYLGMYKNNIGENKNFQQKQGETVTTNSKVNAVTGLTIFKTIWHCDKIICFWYAFLWPKYLIKAMLLILKYPLDWCTIYFWIIKLKAGVSNVIIFRLFCVLKAEPSHIENISRLADLKQEFWQFYKAGLQNEMSFFVWNVLCE